MELIFLLDAIYVKRFTQVQIPNINVNLPAPLRPCPLQSVNTDTVIKAQQTKHRKIESGSQTTLRRNLNGL